MRFATLKDAERLYNMAKESPGFLVDGSTLDGFRLALLREPVVVFEDAMFIFSPFSSGNSFCVHPLGNGGNNVEKLEDACALMETVGARRFVALPLSDDGRVVRFFEKCGFVGVYTLENSIFRNDEWKSQLFMVKGA